LLFFISHSPLEITHKSNDTPPTTPMTPMDELALKRHRFFANILDATHASASNQRIRYNQFDLLNELTSTNSN
jgi:hypothetical protein